MVESKRPEWQLEENPLPSKGFGVADPTSCIGNTLKNGTRVIEY